MGFQDSMKLETRRHIHTMACLYWIHIVCLYWTHMFKYIQENKEESRLDNADMEVKLVQTFTTHASNSVHM